MKWLITKMCSLPKRIKYLLFSVPFILSSVSVFLTCSLLNSTFVEECASNIAVVTKNNTKNNRYLSLLVENKKNAQQTLGSPSDEFYATYGVFGEMNAFFAGTMNADHASSIKIKEIDNCDNLSVLYSYGFKNYLFPGQNEYYRHEFYPIDLMFEGKHDYYNHPGCYYFCYISQSYADYLIANDNSNSQKTYDQLLDTIITIDSNGEEYSFTIGNIYYERNYYYEAVREVAGNFIITGGKELFGNRPQACYFLTDKIYKNKYFLERINTIYGHDSFDVKVNMSNMINKDFDPSSITDFYYKLESNGSKNIAGVLILTVDIIIACVAIFVLNSSDILNRFTDYIFLFLISIVPYFIFFVTYQTLLYTPFFSNAACLVNAIYLFAVILSLLVHLLIKINRKKKQSA